MLVVVSPVVAFLLAEGALRLFGYGYPTSFFIHSPSSDGLTTNPRFAWQFYSRNTALKPFLFTLAPRKPADTIRICVLGESAAMGTPDPAFGFGRILELALRRNFPDRRFEVMNAAMRGINSHIIRLVARECARYEVDYFVVYVGNNEVIGLHAPDPHSPRWTQSLSLIRVTRWFRSCRLGQWLDSVANRLRPAPDERQPQDMAFYRQHRLRADDWRREKVTENFRANLEDICRVATAQGAKVVLATVAVNLKDCPPLGSLHRSGLSPAQEAQWDLAFQEGSRWAAQEHFPEAIAAYESAAKIDDHFAELQFRLGRCYLRSGDAPRALAAYKSARDWDATQLRADGRINQVIRSVGGAWAGQGVLLTDVEREFSESSLGDGQVPGERLFNDHVHPTIAGAYLLARTVYDKLAPVLEQAVGHPARGAVPPLQECLQLVPYTLYDDLNVASAIVGLTSHPPFLDQVDHASRQRTAEAAIQARRAAFTAPDAEACLKTYRTVVSLEPEYWPARLNLAWFYQDLQRYAEAIEQLRYLTGRFPGHALFSARLVPALLKSGDKPAALDELHAAFKRDPGDPDVAAALRNLESPTATAAWAR